RLSYSVLLFLFAFVVQSSYGHVSLTFPPARYPSLDFLDNARTKGPCGVPKPPFGKGKCMIAFHGPDQVCISLRQPQYCLGTKSFLTDALLLTWFELGGSLPFRAVRLRRCAKCAFSGANTVRYRYMANWMRHA